MGFELSLGPEIHSIWDVLGWIAKPCKLYFNASLNLNLINVSILCKLPMVVFCPIGGISFGAEGHRRMWFSGYRNL